MIETKGGYIMKKNKDILIQYIGLIIACMIMAVGLNMFLVP